jgi:hypothetical protein
MAYVIGSILCLVLVTTAFAGTGASDAADDFCVGKPAGLYAAPPGASANLDCRGFYNCFGEEGEIQFCAV